MSSCSRGFECVTAAGGAAGVEVTGLDPAELYTVRSSESSSKPADKTGLRGFTFLILLLHAFKYLEKRVISRKSKIFHESLNCLKWFESSEYKILKDFQ